MVCGPNSDQACLSLHTAQEGVLNPDPSYVPVASPMETPVPDVAPFLTCHP